MMSAVNVLASFPLKEDPKFDDAFIYGEIVCKVDNTNFSYIRSFTYTEIYFFLDFKNISFS